MSGDRHIPALTGLRFYAAGTVLYAHGLAFYFQPFGPHVLSDTWRLSRFGMTLFFVLSGFVIHYNYGASLARFSFGAIWSFAVARFARIYPLYLFALLLALAFLPEPFRTDEFRRTWPLFLTLTQDWWPVDINGKLASEVYVGSAWSLSAEILLYLLYIPLARAIGSLTSREGLMALCALLASMSLFTVIRSSSWGVSMGGGSYYAFYMSPYCRLPEFLLGAIIAAIYRHRSASTNTWAERSPLLVASLFSVIALLVGAYAYGGARFDNLMSSWGFAPACGGLIYYFCRNNGLPSRFVDCRPIVALGDASYSIYLLSGWGLWTFAANGASTTYATAAFREIMAVAFIVIMSLGTYHYLEIPARRAIRKSLRFQARNASALTPVVRDTA